MRLVQLDFDHHVTSRCCYRALFLSLLAVQAATVHSQDPLGFSDWYTDLDSDLLDAWSKMDVVEVMQLVGMGEGLEDRRILHVFGDTDYIEASEGDKLRMKKNGVHFMDVTDHLDLGERNKRRSAPASFSQTPIQIADANIASMLDDLEDAIPHMREDIMKLSSFWTRNAYSPWGLASSNWVYDHVSEILSGHTDGVVTNITKFEHSFIQNSVIARIESKPVNETKQLLIIGAHQDSLNYALPFYRAPGSDDDGSGTVTIMQVLRSIIEHDFIPPPDIAIEFHWYAAEEHGLLGSQDIAAAYEEAEKDVKAMLQIDMTAYVKPGTTPIIAFFKDSVDMNLTNYLGSTVDRYSKLNWNLTTCGPICGSDHMSWMKAGYPAAFAFESLFEDGSPRVHTMHDHWDDEAYSFEHMLEFVKLGIAYITELAVAIF